MKLSIKDIKGQDQEELEVKFPLIENGRGTQAVHDTIVAYRAAQRAGTASTKTMGEVAGSGRKPWRQKGTGRARAGSFASPLWRGGGVALGPKPRDFSKTLSKKTRRLALRKAFSERLTAGETILVNEIKLESPKTKEFIALMAHLEIQGSILLVVAEADKNLTLASRNVPNLEMADGDNVTAYQLLKYDRIVLTKDGYEKLEKRLLK